MSGPVIVAAYPPIHPSPLPPASTFHTSHLPLKAPGKEKRVHSARTPTSSCNDSSATREPVDLPRRKRVHSAIEPRQVVSLSLANTPYGSKVWGETSYRVDYERKKPIPLPKVRPASATRMNNPHPSQMFLQWRIPSRIHQHDRAVAPNDDILKDIREDFYKDYSSNVRAGDDRYEVPITNVAKIPFPGNARNELKLNGRCMTLATRGSSLADKLENAQVLEDVLRPSSYAAIKDWVVQANEREKEVFEKMLQATHTKERDTKKVLAQVFNPSSMHHIQEWLKTADNEELDIAVSVLQDLATRSQKYGREKPVHSHTHTKHCKVHMSTWPKRKAATKHSHSLLELGVQGVSLTRPHSADKCSQCSQSDIGATYKHVQREKSNVWKPAPGLWNHRVLPPQKARLLNGGSMFCCPQQPRGQHFAIHPEWPIA